MFNAGAGQMQFLVFCSVVQYMCEKPSKEQLELYHEIRMS